MGYVVVWFALSIVAGVVAGNKGRSSGGFFLLSLVLSPLVGVIAAIAAKPNTENLEKEQIESGTGRTCPHCAELIKPAAKVCKHCGRDVAALSNTEQSLTSTQCDLLMASIKKEKR